MNDEWMNGWVDGWMYKCTIEEVCVDEETHGYADEWVNGCKELFMNGGTGGWRSDGWRCADRFLLFPLQFIAFNYAAFLKSANLHNSSFKPTLPRRFFNFQPSPHLLEQHPPSLNLFQMYL